MIPAAVPLPADERLRALLDEVAGRRVVVVGNSSGQFSQGLGERIDGFDLVVRMNLGLVREPRHQGSRTDIVFSSTDKLDAATILSAYRPRWTVWATPKRERMPDLAALGDTLVLHPLEVWDALHARTAPARPSTGLIAINLFFQYGRCADLAFAGFDFFASGTFYHRRLFGLLPGRRKSSTAHDGDVEARAAATMIASGRLRDLSAR
ncbi:glycosyltransferase [Azoarcus olearius]|uniref:glycosyltransferase family 29 protein n=1 Tax=Azoarcus sp. (strain BH72) TaxID=418699 RepID=UPI0008062739|nr:glycosyltransferase family 29 protein [Azoarcus olearius]ANQ85479.1 glycosyltransferase [Azoarcus olearius]